MNQRAHQPAARSASREPDATGGLLTRVGRGDVAAFAQLYDDVAPLVYGLAHRVIRDAALAEEITQDVLLTIWQQASRYEEGRGSGRSWILMLAHRRAVDRVRSEQAGRDRNDRYGREMAARPFDGVAEMVETHIDHSAVAAALSDLTPVQRQALTLAYFNGHTYREVGQMLDIPLGTVKTRIRDGLIRLRNVLESNETFASAG